MRLDLIDEFQLPLSPYVAGEGTQLLGSPRSYRLDLVSSTASGSGIVELDTAGTANPAAQFASRAPDGVAADSRASDYRVAITPDCRSRANGSSSPGLRNWPGAMSWRGPGEHEPDHDQPDRNEEEPEESERREE